jgi:TonB-dependent SusC/RagA subfamily outer membrane receptor
LLTNRQIPVSERLAFNNRRDFLNFDIQGSSGMDSLYIILNLPGSASANTYFDGAVSVILSDSVPAGNPAINILTELYLTSDLPGNIEHPAYYLSQATPEIRRNTDLLMLTHGWTRYTWRDIVNNEVPKIKYPPEEGITIEGKITREILEFPLKNADVKLYIQDEYNDEFQTYSGENGRFRFDNLNYSDTIDVKIVARREGGGKNLLIHIEEITPDKVTDLQHDNYLTTESKINMRAYRKIQNKLAQEQMQLREKELDSIFSRSIHGRPDNVLWGDELPSGYSNLQEAMRGRIPGVNITGDRIIIRGVGTLMGSTDPLVIVDDVPTDVSVLRSIPVEDVDRVEILKGPSTAMYGSRGGNGVIAVYTKRGSYMKKGEIEFSMLGYHITEKFYSPGTSTIQQKADNKMLPVTLYWNPEIEVGSKEVQIAIPNERNSLNKIIIIEGTDGQGNIGYGYAVLR